MHYYRVFGGVLASELSFPDRAPAPRGPADWTLVTSSETSAANAEFLGEDEVELGIKVRLYRDGSRFRLDFDDTGTFHVSSDGARIDWTSGGGARAEAVRLDVIGRVLPLAMHAAGILTLHGSAVAVRGMGIGFLAPKYHGKSTLAQALVAAGARMLTDDALPVEIGAAGEVRIRPGTHAARLWGDSRAWLAREDTGPTDAGAEKYLVGDLPEAQLVHTPVPLAALYLLAPRLPKPQTPAASRGQLDPMRSALSLVVHAKVGPLLGKGEAGPLLARAAAVSAQVPVHTLRIVRSFDRLDEAVAQILEWHDGAHRASAYPLVGGVG
jgi:hypothetical protein